jgi:chromate transporter
MLLWQSSWGQILVILLSGLFGLLFLKMDSTPDQSSLHIPISRVAANISISLFAALLFGMPLLLTIAPNHILALIDSFYRTGSLVFGGGHVVLPLLQAEVVPPGWISNDLFLAGYGAAQAVPGPLFTFAAYLGAIIQPGPGGWVGGMICLVSIFLPSFLLLFGILPYWDQLRRKKSVRCALIGVNAAVVGLLLAAFYNPVWTSSIMSGKDFILGLVAFGLLVLWKVPPWMVVAVCALGAAILAML